MPTVHYYGKKSNFVGKTLFEILANLRNFGVNRMLLKQEELLRNPGQKCYYVVKKVEPVLDKDLQQGAIYAEKVFRGAKVPELVFVDDDSWHTDWQLVPKDEEDNYRVPEDKLLHHGQPETVRVLPRWMEVPPLMDIFLRRHYKTRGISDPPVKMDSKLLKIKMYYDFQKLNKPHEINRMAEEGEESEFKINHPMKTLINHRVNPHCRS